MKIIKITLFLFPVIILTKPIYGDDQLSLLLKNHFNNNLGSPELLGIHIYNDKKGKVLQADIEITANENHIIMTMNAMSQIGQYSKTPFHKFIIIEHYPKEKIPTGYESDADCAINYFVRKKITKNIWMKNCLSSSIIQREIENWSTLNKN
tara:strand:- start:712 stop:1164 length:453 start_codon:yes stop_codon:yes gene_type:complete